MDEPRTSGNGRAARAAGAGMLSSRVQDRPAKSTSEEGPPDQLLRPLALRAMFMRPAYLAQSAWLEHVPFAFWLVEAHQPGTIVELGTHYGVSYFALCQAVERLGLDARCYAVDSWEGDAHAGFYGEKVFEQVRAHNDAHYSGFSRLVRSSFDEALDHFSDRTVDLLHIDGLHTLEAVRHDFQSWLPKLSDRAVVLLHDSNVRERDFGVFRLVEQLRQQYPCFEFVHGHGLAVLGVGSDQSEYLERLFAVGRHDAARRAVQEMFARLGRATADAHAAQELEASGRALELAVSQQETQLENLQQRLKRAKSAVQKRDAKVKKARARLKGQAEQHAVERGRLDERATLLLQLRDESREEGARLAARADQAAAELKERTDALIALQTGFEEKQRLLDAAEAEAARERDATRAARAELERHREALATTRAELEARQRSFDSVHAELEQARTELKAAEQAASSAKAQAEFARGELRQEQTEHSATLARLEAEQEGAASARAELDEVSQQLDGEREARTAIETRLAAEREAAADVQTELDEARGELERGRQTLGATRSELESVREQAEATAKELEATRYECARAQEAEGAAQANLERERHAMTALQAELDRARAELAQQSEIAEKAQFGLEAERHSRANAEQALEREKAAAADAAKRHRDELADQESRLRAAAAERDRFRAEAESSGRKLAKRDGELEKLRAEAARRDEAAKKIQSGLETERQARTTVEQALEKEKATAAETAKHHREELAKQESRLSAAETERDRFRAEAESSKRKLEERVAELARLTRLLQESEARTEQQERELDTTRKGRHATARLLGQAIVALGRYTPERPPRPATLERLGARLKEAGVLDPDWYLERNRDVSEAALDPIRHYLLHGVREGREPCDIRPLLDDAAKEESA